MCIHESCRQQTDLGKVSLLWTQGRGVFTHPNKNGWGALVPAAFVKSCPCVWRLTAFGIQQRSESQVCCLAAV